VALTYRSSRAPVGEGPSPTIPLSEGPSLRGIGVTWYTKGMQVTASATRPRLKRLELFVA